MRVFVLFCWFLIGVSKLFLFLHPKNKGVPFLLRQVESAEIIPSNLIRVMPA